MIAVIAMPISTDSPGLQEETYLKSRERLGKKISD